MPKFEAGDLVMISADAAPCGGELAVVTTGSNGLQYGTSVMPLTPYPVNKMAYEVHELTPVLLDGQRLRVQRVSA